MDALKQIVSEIDVTKPSFRIAIISICFNPIFWNIVARLEYKTHFLTKLAGGAKRGCYLLAITIFSLGILRDYLYEQALREQPTSAILNTNLFKGVALGCFISGNVFVLSSMYALGVTGTYLGD